MTGAGTLFWVEPEGLDPPFRSLTGRRRSVLAHRGALEQAEALVRTAVATAE